MRTVPRSITVTIDERARNAFFTYYVLGFAKTYDVLDMLYSRSSLDKHLKASVDAASLAFFSSQFHCLEAANMGWNRYLSALPLLNQALGSTETAKSDSTLLSTLLLDLFEKTTSTAPRSIESWMGHVNGALALVKMRDADQLLTHVGLRLAVRLCTNLLISCVIADEPVPPAWNDLRCAIDPLFNHDPKWNISALVVKFLGVRKTFKDGVMPPMEVVSLAAHLDNEFQVLAWKMPPKWRSEVIHLENPADDCLDCHFDRYLDRFITQTWNVLRIMRILLNDMIVNLSLKAAGEDSFYTIVSDNAAQQMDNLAREICASAPQYLTRTDYPTLASKDPAAERMQCYTLIFPLYTAGRYSRQCEVKPWIVGRLAHLSDVTGIKKASAVSEFLQREERTSPWVVYTILGSYAFAA